MDQPSRQFDNDTLCTGLKKDGTPCTARRIGGSMFCNFHSDPDRHHELSVKGGEARRKFPLPQPIPDSEPMLRLETPNDVLKLIEKTVDDVRRNRVRPDQATMIAYLGNVALQAMKTDVERGAEEKPLPEIKEIARSSDPRATSDEYPGSDFGGEAAN